MKKLLKYLLSVMVLAAFGNHVDESERMVSEVASADMVRNDHEICHSGLSAPETELCIPRQVSVANTPRVLSTPRRTGGLHRGNVEFAKSGRVINADIRYFVQRNSIIIHSSRIEPALRLITLGRLTI